MMSGVPLSHRAMKTTTQTNSPQLFVSATGNDLWLGTLDMYPIGWTMCPQNNTYLHGFYIEVQDSSGKYRIQEGRCSAVESSFNNQPAICKNANWGSVLDR